MAENSTQNEHINQELPGLIMKQEQDKKFDPDKDRDLLEARIENKIEGDFKTMEFSGDCSKAFIEFKNAEDLDRVAQSEIRLRKYDSPLIVERIDMMDFRSSYLVVTNLPDFMDEATIKLHFEQRANNQISSVTLKSGNTAEIKFVNPKAALKFGKQENMFGFILDIEVKSEIPSHSPNVEEMVLMVSNIPKEIPSKTLPIVLKKYFETHTNYKCENIELIKNEAYLTFDDVSAVRAIEANPPTAAFIGDIHLDISAIPMSELKDKSGLHEVDSKPITEYPRVNKVQLGSSQQHMMQQSLAQQSLAQQSLAQHSLAQHSLAQLRFSQWPTNSPFWGQAQSALESHTPMDHKLVPSIKMANMTRKVLVEGVPDINRDEAHIKEYFRNLVNVSCKVTQYGEKFFLQFSDSIDFDELKMKSQQQSYEGVKLLLYELSPSDTILVVNLAPTLSDYYLEIFFKQHTSSNTIVDIKRNRSKTKALIQFASSDDVQAVLTKPECFRLEEVILDITEYYGFMSILMEKESLPSLSSAEPISYSWSKIDIEISQLKSIWFKSNLAQINERLMSLKARSVLSTRMPPCLSIIPLEGSQKNAKWEEDIQKEVEELLSCLKKASLSINEDHKAEILQKALAKAGPDLIVKLEKNDIIVFGHADMVNEFVSELNTFINEIHIRQEERCYSSRYVKFLNTISRAKLDAVGVTEMEFIEKEQKLIIKGNRVSREKFWFVVENEIKSIKEKHIVIPHPNLFALLKSEKGIKKITEVINASNSSIVYYLDDSSGNMLFYLMSNKSIDEDKLRTLKKQFKKNFEIVTIPLNSSEVEVCQTTQKWKSYVNNDAFLSIALDYPSSHIILTGEKIALSGTCEKIRDYLADECSIETKLDIFTVHEWKVISSNCKQKLSHIQQECQSKVKITFSQKETTTEIVSIELKGDPISVDHVRAKLEALKGDVYHQVEFMKNVPSARQIVDSIEDKVKCIAQEQHASIAVSVKLDNTSACQLSQTAAAPVTKCFSGFINDVIRITVLCGDYIHNTHNVDTIINFVSNDARDTDHNLKLLFSLSNGHLLCEEFHFMRKSLFSIDPGYVFKMKNKSNLKCTDLWHSCTLPWNGGNSSEDYYLEISINQALAEAQNSISILFTSPCTDPLSYPAKVFASKMISSLTSISRELSVLVFLNKLENARLFEEEFKKSYQCRLVPFPQSQSTTVLPAPIPNLHNQASINIGNDKRCSLEKNNLLDVKADVIINSTNEDLDLSRGMISKLLVKTCGTELQKECSQLAPLRYGDVAVSGARNMKCKSIYHISLPAYKDSNSIKIFQQTIEAILHRAEQDSVSSVAIPSLGIGNLGYPAQKSADIMFECICSFIKKNPKSKTNYLVVVYEKKIFDEFQSVYKQKIKSFTSNQKSTATEKVIGSTLLSIVNGDIAEEICDVIVNTTTPNFSNTETAVSKAIMTKGGPILKKQCASLVSQGHTLAGGEVISTLSSGQLRSKQVFHSYIPNKGSEEPYQLIFQVVSDCLHKSEQLGMTSIAFPAFGLGRGNYSTAEIAKPMLAACVEFGKAFPKCIQQINIVINDASLHSEFYDLFLKFFGLEQSHGLTSYLPKFLGGGVTLKTVNLQDPNLLKSGNLQVGANLVVCFDIYGPSVQTCNLIASKLRELIKNKCDEQTIKHPIIANLTDADIDEIQSVGLGKVRISFMERIQSIQITGPKLAVMEVRGKVKDILNEIQTVHETLKSKCWKNYSRDDEQEYSFADSCKLERALLNGKNEVKLIVDNMHITVNLIKFEDINQNSKTVRKVIREDKPQVPSTWVKQDRKFGYKYEVWKGSMEYDNALKEFLDTITTKVTIVKLERIQNPTLYFDFDSRITSIKRKHQFRLRDVEVKTLFHGSQEESVNSIISTGFNRNFAADANAAFFGRGVYFALNASYSAQDQYSRPNTDGVKFIFICSVVIGEYTVGNQHMKLAPPLPDDPSSTYDTLVNNQASPAIFVAMSDGQAYPNYLVSFKIDT